MVIWWVNYLLAVRGKHAEMGVANDGDSALVAQVGDRDSGGCLFAPNDKGKPKNVLKLTFW